MSIDLFFIIGPLFIVLFLYAIPFTKDFASKYSNEFIFIFAGYFFLLADIKNEDKNLLIFDYSWIDINTPLIVIGLTLSLIHLFVNYKSKSKYITDEELLNTVNDLNNKFETTRKEFYKLCSDIIKSNFNLFFEESQSSRISIYKYENDRFYLLGRYSPIQKYNTPSRTFYPSNEGFIAKGWEDEFFEIYDIPTHRGRGRDWKKIIKNNCTISNKTLDNIRMKSCSFYIQKIENEDSRASLGIIVAEKISGEKINSNYIRKTLKQNHQVFSSLIKSMKTMSKD